MPREASQKLTCGAMALRPLRPDHASRLDGADGVDPVAKSVPVRAQPRKLWSSALVLLVGRMVVAAGRVRLPGLDQHVLGHVAGAIEDAALDGDPLARDAAAPRCRR